MSETEDSTIMIRAEGLTKAFGALVAVDGVDFEVRKGEAFGLLGPNGAGKSTIMRMIASVSRRSGGTLSILGMDPDERGPDTLDDAEEQVMREELSGILEHIDAIRAMDLDGVPPTTHVIELENVLRADEPRQGLSQEDALREARAVVDGSFEVPRMD